MVIRQIKRKKVIPGDIFAIDLGSSSYGYAVVIKPALTGFYDLQTQTMEQEIGLILSRSILFKVPVMRYAFKSDHWHLIGNVELSDDLKQRVYFFKQDFYDKSISLYYEEGNEGIEIPATYEDIKGLERAAVWDPEHVEDRLRDHFNNVTNVWVEQLKPKM